MDTEMGPSGQPQAEFGVHMHCVVFGNQLPALMEGVNAKAPGPDNLDSLVDKTFQLTQTMPLGFGAELFNFTNSPHFGARDTTTGSQEAGIITSDEDPNREIQFGLRLRF